MLEHMIKRNRVLRYDLDKLMEVYEKPINKYRPLALVTKYSGYMFGRPRYDIHIVNLDTEIKRVKLLGKLSDITSNSHLWHLKTFNGDYYDFKNYLKVQIQNMS